MSGGADESKVAEALSELQQYLSDAISPLVASESVGMLVALPAEVVADEIRSWMTSQHRRTGASVSVSDYLYHAARKLYMMGEFTLVSREAMNAYLEGLLPQLVALCPAGDRELLGENLAHLGDAHSDLTTPAATIHRLRGQEAASAGDDAESATKSAVAASRHFAQLVERLASIKVPTTPTEPSAAAREDVFSHLVSTAARRAETSEEFEHAKENLRSFGSDVPMENVIRALARRLPAWILELPPGTEGPPPPVSSTARAMERIVTLESDPHKAASRFEELVKAAIEQVNEGSLARAATMLDLAGILLAEKKVDPAYVRGAREQGHEQLDPQRLRRFAEDPISQPLLRRVLGFFPALGPAGLLDSLRSEEKRDRRHLLLALLEVHGAAARAPAVERLEASMSAFGDREGHYQRNLLYVLRRLPRPEGWSLDTEVQAAIRLSAVGRPVMVLKEAVAYLGQIRDERAEHALIARVGEYEAAVLRAATAGGEPPELMAMLDRAVFALARVGTQAAWRAVVNHGLKRSPQLGDTASRLAQLASVDLSGDPETVGRIVDAIDAELPHKIFGFLLKKDWSYLLRLIEAVSGSTRSPGVRNALADMVQRFPNEEFARVAARVLAGVEVSAPPPAPEAAPTASLSGDLELFGLPTLLQNLSQSTASGTLTITDAIGEQVATVALENGKFRDCRAGDLGGEVALFQLIERPTQASFVFVKKVPPPDGAAAEPTKDLVPLFFEGTRRYDEFQQACMLVPDYACLRPTQTKPSPPPEEGDPLLIRTVWQRASSGASALECESGVQVDSYRTRRMLAHWVEEGALEPR